MMVAAAAPPAATAARMTLQRPLPCVTASSSTHQQGGSHRRQQQQQQQQQRQHGSACAVGAPQLALPPPRLGVSAVRCRASSGTVAAAAPRDDAGTAAAAGAGGAYVVAPDTAASAPPPPTDVASSGLGPSRLERQVERLVAIDVEYTHLQLLPGRRHVSLPAEVCALDAQGEVLLWVPCNPIEGPLERQRWRHVGGMPPAAWRQAQPLSEVRRQLAALLTGRILVGHHLRKDLAALALSHPQADTRDTLQYRELQGRRGSGRKLRELSAEKLGRSIQHSGSRHCPREDAAAAMDLYLRHIHFAERYMRYEDLVQFHLAGILQAGSSEPTGSHNPEGDSSSGRGASSSDSSDGGSSGGNS